jgi:hypothetical protein
MAPNTRTIRLKDLPIGVTSEDIKSEIMRRCSVQDSKSWWSRIPLIGWGSKKPDETPSPQTVQTFSGPAPEELDSSAEQGTTDQLRSSQFTPLRLQISIASFKNDTQMATVTLPTTELCQRCLQTDDSSNWVVDDNFDGLTILHSPKDADIE